MHLKFLAVLFLISVGFAGFKYHRYHNDEFNYIDFNKEKLIASNKKSVGKMVKDPVAPEDTVTEITYSGFDYEFHYNNTINQVIVQGVGRDQIYNLDSQKRPIRLSVGYVLTTLFEYSENKLIIEEYPNTPEVTEHSTRWTYKFKPNGDTDVVIITPTDWEYQQTPHWAPQYSDTVTFHYDSNGKQSGIKIIMWKTNLFHNVPWKKELDSITFNYDTLEAGTPNEKRITTITQLSPFGQSANAEWKSTKGDTQYVETRDIENRLIKEVTRRWDNSSFNWDTQYFTVSEHQYTGSLIVHSLSYQYFGDGTSRYFLAEVKRTYRRSDLLHGVPTSITNSRAPQANFGYNFTCIGNCIVKFSGNINSFDQIAVFSLTGRILKSCENRREINLQNLSLGQPLIFVALKNGKVIAKNKIILR